MAGVTAKLEVIGFNDQSYTIEFHGCGRLSILRDTEEIAFAELGESTSKWIIQFLSGEHVIGIDSDG